MGKPLTNHVIVLSFDCLSALDFPILQELPHFRSLIEQGAIAKKVEAIYPSVTYPSHATIVTGNYPNKHGVVSNTLLQPGRESPDWHWYRRSIKGTTLYDEARKANLTTAALLWPVTGRAKIDYNLPEIFPNRPWQNQVLVSLFSGSPLYQLDLNRRFGHIRKGLSQPELDDFVLASAVHTIQTKKPNVMFVHFTDLDTQRHYHGFSSTETTAAIQRHDERLGKIIKALKETGIYEASTIIALGDHSALSENKAIQLNVLFHQKGLISVNQDGKLTNWKAYCQSCDGSAYVHVKDKNDIQTIQAVQHLLEELLQDKQNGIEFILHDEGAKERGADGNCLFMLEAREGYYFTENYTGEFIKEISEKDVTPSKKYTFGTHGYSPTKPNYETIFIAAGKGIRQGAIIPYMRLIDEGPTIARLLGLYLGETDGTIIEDLLQL
ncbi:ectonucleotide pyrophosphatase/phosphodiesterase [Bacillus pseudomycoides]|uniref:Alkaline phosphatase family protein n=1 Tax=Bacillus pseudomycoides TaxID=64104 RepID=A0AAJ1Z5H1_9BACI|nr:ectonucleotide pyrophosphatase/phosphodiesterase [Bacillus pseudomycoides]MDR4326766.1 alkaline phosphatase family protein [Bacillus pseudomycoides]MED1536704.1 ectonucleotide pyrophosphatase/phosphodiesterase [Bacillus pseudomycoides]PEF23600.1 alkaline phosphatase family protein [Bacillus pseudomycoides]PFZ90546.1 alkaline phosphatase family protein [Bacillus pseudomycoides]PGD71349.1 alkaline phosphatase family protein [Bacillus pseudomycoides]